MGAKLALPNLPEALNLREENVIQTPMTAVMVKLQGTMKSVDSNLQKLCVQFLPNPNLDCTEEEHETRMNAERWKGVFEIGCENYLQIELGLVGCRSPNTAHASHSSFELSVEVAAANHLRPHCHIGMYVRCG